MDFMCPACGAPAPSMDSLCSGSFTDPNHPSNVPPVPTRLELRVEGPLDNPNPDLEWGAREVLEARSIIRRLLSPPALTAEERAAFLFWLERTNPSPAIYAQALRS